ncbi:MAG: chromosomal replication initiator protein DnaA [Oscillospiraceae bacterium]|nr:chromosomal replication initiator protein DnaA [Oscillospiraceae bacterium]
MNSNNDIWLHVIDVLKEKFNLSETALNTWLRDCSVVDVEDNRLVLYTENRYKGEQVSKRFGSNIKEALSDLFACDFDLIVLSGEELDDYKALSKAQNTLPEMDGYTFDNFIVGNSNRYAHAAACAVAEKPGTVYNPFFIYGNSGLGKTHLLYAIGSFIHEKNPAANIVYVKGDEFTNEMVRSIQTGKAEDFRKKYRTADLFLVDDIQFIAGKESTQEEFFHTFNSIYEAGHQIVITSDRPPMEMMTLDDRLRTRFESSLMADVQPPDVETRMAIIRNKSGKLGMPLADDVVAYIAERVTSNVRQIEGVVKRLTAYHSIMQVGVDVEIAKKAIKDVVREGTFVPPPELIIRTTANYFQISEDDIIGQRRSKNIALARHVAIYLIRNLTNLSLNDIGSIFEGRNHATVLSSINKIEEIIKTDEKMSNTIRDITSNINSQSSN